MFFIDIRHDNSRACHESECCVVVTHCTTTSYKVYRLEISESRIKLEFAVVQVISKSVKFASKIPPRQNQPHRPTTPIPADTTTEGDVSDNPDDLKVASPRNTAVDLDSDDTVRRWGREMAEDYWFYT